MTVREVASGKQMSRIAVNAESLRRTAESNADWMFAAMRRLVEAESPSDDKAAVDVCGGIAAELAEQCGGRAKRHRQRDFGDVLEVRWGSARKRTDKRAGVLLLGHLDTVWPLGTLQKMPWRENTGTIWGPGVLDMKAGVAMALTAMRVVGEFCVRQPVTLLLNSEEEIGSPVSRAITENLARESDAVLVLEPAQGLACKTARKGVGNYRIEVRGVAAHAGVDFERGHSAVLELARLLEKIADFTDLPVGRTMNPGVIGGGTRSNVIAERAWAEIDVRIAKAADAAKVGRMFRALKCEDKRCSVKISGGINRPPMERSAGTVRLYKQARAIAKQIGFVLDEAATGGGSDGNFTAALGVPTLDGLGAVGEGAHAAHEKIAVEHLVPRTVLLAGLIASIATRR